MTKMPQSSVLDNGRNMRPEWRRYLEAANTAIQVLRNAGLDSGTAQILQQLQDRLSALQLRIEALPAKAVTRSQRIVKYRGEINNSSGAATFPHDLGTRHVFWQIRDLDNGNVFGPTSSGDPDINIRGIQVESDTEGAIRFAGVGAGRWDALFYGVISDFA